MWDVICEREPINVILLSRQAQLLTLIALAGKLKVGLAAGGFLASRRRGKRAATFEEPLEVTLEQLAALEVDDCYKRLFCSAAAGGLGGAEGVEQLLLLVGPDAHEQATELRAPGSKQAERIREAAVFGMSRFFSFLNFLIFFTFDEQEGCCQVRASLSVLRQDVRYCQDVFGGCLERPLKFSFLFCLLVFQ